MVLNTSNAASPAALKTWAGAIRSRQKPHAPLLELRDAASVLMTELPRAFPVEQINDLQAYQTWEAIARYIGDKHGPHEEIALMERLYEQMLQYQLQSNVRIHKGMPLVWISECHKRLRRPALAKRFLMLTLIEDALRDGGKIDAASGGVYFRAVWEFGMSALETARYAREAVEIAATNAEAAAFPEWILQELDDAWMSEYPSSEECAVYFPNPVYIRWLLGRLGDGTGEWLERLGSYIVSVMPGCRARKERSHSTDYDIMCSMEGPQHDFRSELGRYFVCECKDWSRPANFTAFAKFCRVLDSAKCRFGILFSREGITGTDETTDAAREQLKVFSDRNMVIVVIDRRDLETIADGGNFLSMLRAKYEAVRMDLRRLRQL